MLEVDSLLSLFEDFSASRSRAMDVVEGAVFACRR